MNSLMTDLSAAEPSKILVAGDTHGNPLHAEYLFGMAVYLDMDVIVQVGDFGYWEHEDEGVFLDLCSAFATENDMPLYFIDGNHENHTMLRDTYGPGGARHKQTPAGFWQIRAGVYYIPRGHRWEWSGVTMMGLGGAHSVDKNWRLDIERNGGLDRNGRRRPAPGPRTLWWPEEELTDEDVTKALADPRFIDILFTHDRPRGANPGWDKKDLPECQPNQDRIQTVMRELRPRLLVHGHLHRRYTDEVRVADDHFTTVIGLDCDTESDHYPLLQHIGSTDEPDLAIVAEKISERLEGSWIGLDLSSQ